MNTTASVASTQHPPVLLRCVWHALMSLVLLLAGCESKLVQEFPLTKFKAENMLDEGIRVYDDGDYKTAAKDIQAALDAGLTTQSQARAHKYLAFIYCISDQVPKCRDEFKSALQVDPLMQLKPEEAGHPSWGPVFRSVKAEAGKP